MRQLLMRYLLLSSCLFILLGCKSVYKNLQPATGDIKAIEKFKPNLKVALYRAEVDVVGHHLSGLLLIKTLPDSSIRMVFSNEMGFKFFDFEYKPDGGFKVYSIISQMDKKAVIKTLKKDFELIMMRNSDQDKGYLLKDNDHLYYVFKNSGDYHYYITDKATTKLIRMERSSARKPVVEAIMKNYVKGIPDTIGITHKNFSFTIGLKRLER